MNASLDTSVSGAPRAMLQPALQADFMRHDQPEDHPRSLTRAVLNGQQNHDGDGVE
jgi:hypothetical protein